MEIIIKNWDSMSLTLIPDNELKLVRKNNEEVITDFNLSEEDKQKIYKGCKLNPDFTIKETPEYLENIKQEAIDNAYNTFNNTLAFITSHYSDNERASFELKRQEAEKVIAGWESVFLETLVLEGETVLELANKIKANSEAYQLLYANAEKKLREDLKNI